MKKKFLAGVAIITLAVGGLMATRPTTQSPLSALQMENIETLTADETPIPVLNCYSYPDEVCHMVFFDASGCPHLIPVKDLKHIQ